jgi:hypothetical protein
MRTSLALRRRPMANGRLLVLQPTTGHRGCRDRWNIASSIGSQLQTDTESMVWPDEEYCRGFPRTRLEVRRGRIESQEFDSGALGPTSSAVEVEDIHSKRWTDNRRL